MAKGKRARGNASQTQRWMNVGADTAPERVGQRAKEVRDEKFNNLLSHLRVPLLRRAYFMLKKEAAPGVDGRSWKSYGEQLESRLEELENQLHRGSYRPPPVRRVQIPKGDGRNRALGLPTVEDKIVQQAVRMLLEPIYENSAFLGFSYGYRPGRSQHDALDALHEVIKRKKVNWVLDADVQSFFDEIDHDHLRRFLEHRISDRRLLRLIMRWLKAGVMEEDVFHPQDTGTPQGGVISPLLANIYLHYAFDLWIDDWRERHAEGEVYVIRFADDIVMCFQYEREAKRFQRTLAERLAKFGLTFHPEKTRVIRFGRFAREDSHKDDRTKPETFDFLGFTHYCGRDRHGKFKVGRRTSKKKRKAKYAELRKEIRRRTHHPVPVTLRWLNRVLRGHYNYYAVPGNLPALRWLWDQVKYCWRQRLSRRSQRARWSEKRWKAFWKRYVLVRPKIVHPYPNQRFVCP